MAPFIKSFSAIFIIQGGFGGIYEEYLYIKDDKVIIRNGLEFYEVKLEDNKIYNYIEKICKKKHFDFNEVPLPVDALSFKIIINKPCNKELEIYAIGFGNKPDRLFMNEIYETSRNLKYKIIKQTLPSKIIIHYYKIENFEKPLYIDLSEYDFKDEFGDFVIENKAEISKILEKLKAYKGGRFYYIKNKNNYYQATFEIKIDWIYIVIRLGLRPLIPI